MVARRSASCVYVWIVGDFSEIAVSRRFVRLTPSNVCALHIIQIEVAGRSETPAMDMVPNNFPFSPRGFEQKETKATKAQVRSVFVTFVTLCSNSNREVVSSHIRCSFAPWCRGVFVLNSAVRREPRRVRI